MHNHHSQYAVIVCTLVCSYLSAGLAFSQDEDICALVSCTTSVPKNSSIEKYCNQSRGLVMKERCCRDLSTGSIVGIDLSWCSITSLGNMLFDQAPLLLSLNLTFNPDFERNNTSFRGLTKLKTLSVPLEVGCPGDSNWFNATWKGWNIDKEHKNYRVCMDQTKTCASLKHYNYTCPENSVCNDDGPGNFNCTCSPGWGGYKCLRRTDKQLTIPIVCSSFGSAVVLSIIFWFLERRHATNK